MFTLYRDPTCLTWRATALRCTVNSLHSWYKLPLTLTTYHITCSLLPCLDMLLTLDLCMHASTEFSAEFNYVERGLRSMRVRDFCVQFYDVTSWNYVNLDDPLSIDVNCHPYIQYATNAIFSIHWTSWYHKAKVANYWDKHEWAPHWWVEQDIYGMFIYLCIFNRYEQ